MPQQSSLEVVFERLREWSRFPKYSLERQLDIFLTLFLEPYPSARMEAPVMLVAPEFPIKLETSNQSVNVDYLLRRGGRDPAWIFLELKTDARSFRDEQLRHYLRAKERGMTTVLGEVDAIHDATLPVHRPKYDLLRKTVAGSGALVDRIEIAYLSPADPKHKDVLWCRMHDFLSWQPQANVDLWAEIVRVLRPPEV